MRLPLLAFCLLALGACAYPEPVAYYSSADQRAERDSVRAAEDAARTARRARADSLLALPADSLTVEDLRFVQLVQAERNAVAEARADRAAADAASSQRRSRGIVTYLVVGGVLSLVAGLFFAFEVAEATP